MMQRMKEISSPLSPLNIVQPLTRGAFLVHEDDGVNQENISFEDRNCFSKSKLFFPKGCHESSAFRFSISRLPKWAQKEVVSSEIVPHVTETILSQSADVCSTPLASHDQVNASLPNEVETFRDLGLEDIKRIIDSVSSTDTCNSRSQSYIISEEDIRFSKKRWQTIHTVCLDLVSPEVGNRRNNSIMPLSSMIMLQSTSDPGEETDRFSKDSLNGNAKCFNDVKEIDIFSSPVRRDQHHGTLNNLVERLTPSAKENKVQLAFEAEHQPDSLFELHFSNLSAVRKVEKQSSILKRYSSRFSVQRNHIKGCKTLTSSRDEVCTEKAVSCISLGKFSPDVIGKQAQIALPEKEEDSLMTKAEKLPNADFRFFQSESLDLTIKKDSASSRMNQLGTAERDPNILNEQETITQCREALSGLNAAAETVHSLFTKLASLLPKEDCPASPATDVYLEAVRLLPSIAEKIHAVSDLVHPETKRKHITLHPTRHN
ncbi:hypothetical protein QQ045_024381 [Rhodiola kirilowii]